VLNTAQPLQLDQTSSAAGGSVGSGGSSDVPSPADLAQLFHAAVNRWTSAGWVSSSNSVQTIQVRTDDLPANLLAAAYGNTIVVDRNAAGVGWFVDSTPDDDAEFTGGSAAGKVDLLTVIEHELGHLLGLGHEDDGVMDEMLSIGTRRKPSAVAVDRVFNNGWE